MPITKISSVPVSDYFGKLSGRTQRVLNEVTSSKDVESYVALRQAANAEKIYSNKGITLGNDAFKKAMEQVGQKARQDFNSIISRIQK